ncbi:hypothetical protein CP973_04770 [Streptomyces albofaciens JCM 4342]|uniref:hypothetical protein n=1 Tax=Streptomyces albofaciens TaxID=66866 RepID=UPI000AC0C08C|nr:hypothetical protein [Streptomyces albofaciens]KAA6221374.1 hypothetical protein CP973_04770 [Streptomyces albofaciens JCM 4342]
MRRLTTFAVSAAIAGGVLFSAVPAQAAVSAKGKVTCHIEQMDAQVKEHQYKAAKLDRAGKHQAAKKERAKARSIQKRIQQCIDAEKNNPGPFGK